MHTLKVVFCVVMFWFVQYQWCANGLPEQAATFNQMPPTPPIDITEQDLPGCTESREHFLKSHIKERKKDRKVDIQCSELKSPDEEEGLQFPFDDLEN